MQLLFINFNEAFTTLDLVLFAIYCLGIIGLGLFVSRTKKGQEKNSSDYFLAGKSLPWWAIGTSLIASNISAEQFIGMSGSAYAMGLAISTYEWMAAATLIIVGKFFLPIFLKNNIFTMPQFLEQRFDPRVRLVFAVLWLLLYIFVNMTAVLYMGALAIQTIMGPYIGWGIAFLVLFSLLYALYGGLQAVAWTDVVQVVFLVAGGLITTYLALNAVSDGGGPIAGFVDLVKSIPEKFEMLPARGEIEYEVKKGSQTLVHDAYQKLPGLSVLIGGMWIVNLNYWGFNQYITQRALGGKNLEEAQRGVMFAGYLKILMPFIIVVPGIAASYLNPELSPSDKAYPWLLEKFVGPGFKGIAFAALVAAIVSSLSSMANSTSTIFTMDLYRNYFNRTASEGHLVTIGRLVAFLALLVAALVAIPLLGNLDQAFQYIQDFTGYISPGIVCIFLFGLFWSKASANSAIWAAILTVPISASLDIGLPYLHDIGVLEHEMPFMNRMGITFLLLCAIVMLITLNERKDKDPHAVEIKESMFYTSNVFNVGSLGIIGILAVLYTVFGHILAGLMVVLIGVLTIFYHLFGKKGALVVLGLVIALAIAYGMLT